MMRINTVSVTFEPVTPEAVRTLDVHLFVKNVLRLGVTDVLGLQLESGNGRRFFVKLSSAALCDRVVSAQSGLYSFTHGDGSSHGVKVRHASGLGTQLVRVFDLPMELDNKVIAESLKPYGKVKGLKIEVWASADLPFKVPNGVRQVTIELDRHIPSYVHVPKHGKVLMKYTDQPQTCSICDSPKHFRLTCPNKRQPGGWRPIPPPPPNTNLGGGFVPLGGGKPARPVTQVPVKGGTKPTKEVPKPASSAPKVPPGPVGLSTSGSPGEGTHTPSLAKPVSAPQSTPLASPVPAQGGSADTPAVSPVSKAPEPPVGSREERSSGVTPHPTDSAPVSTPTTNDGREPRSDDWHEEVEKTANMVQIESIFTNSLPDENVMDSQSDGLKRGRDTSTDEESTPLKVRLSSSSNGGASQSSTRPANLATNDQQ